MQKSIDQLEQDIAALDNHIYLNSHHAVNVMGTDSSARVILNDAADLCKAARASIERALNHNDPDSTPVHTAYLVASHAFEAAYHLSAAAADIADFEADQSHPAPEAVLSTYDTRAAGARPTEVA